MRAIKEKEKSLVKRLIDAELFRFFQLSAMASPRARDIESFRRWMATFKPLIQEESVFLQLTDDLVSPRRSDEVGFLEEGIERLVRKTGVGRKVGWLSATE